MKKLYTVDIGGMRVTMKYDPLLQEGPNFAVPMFDGQPSHVYCPGEPVSVMVLRRATDFPPEALGVPVTREMVELREAPPKPTPEPYQQESF